MRHVGNPSVEAIKEEVSRHHDLPGWIFSGPPLLALSQGVEPSFGPRGRYFKMLFRVFGNTFVSLMVVRLVMLVTVVQNWCSCLRVRPDPVPTEVVFVGFGAGAEREMVTRLRSESPGKVPHIDQTCPASLALVARPSLWRMICYAWSVPKKVFMSLAECECTLVRGHLGIWLPTAAIRVKDFILFKAWFDNLPATITRLVFISADVPAFAVLSARKIPGVPEVEYWQHGFLQKSIIFPAFDRVEVLTVPESRYLEACLPGRVRIKEVKTGIRNNYRAVIVFASIYNTAEFDKEDHIPILKELFEWAATLNVSVILRLHPRESDNFWRTHFPDQPIDRDSESFDDCLDRHCPQFVFSWFSTALIDALRRGHLPCMITAGTSRVLDDMIFPLAEIALHWPRDMELIGKASNDQRLYRKELISKQYAAFGGVSPEKDISNRECREEIR